MRNSYISLTTTNGSWITSTTWININMLIGRFYQKLYSHLVSERSYAGKIFLIDCGRVYEDRIIRPWEILRINIYSIYQCRNLVVLTLAKREDLMVFQVFVVVSVACMACTFYMLILLSINVYILLWYSKVSWYKE